MALNYSIREAKAKFSEVIRQVRNGKSITITHRGKPVAEIRSIERWRTPTLEKRLGNLEKSGILVRPTLPKHTFRPVVRRRGA